MPFLTWLVRVVVFLALFVFALNNQQEAAVQWFFGHAWRAPMVFILLAAFALGCSLGIAAMLPSWWRHRRLAKQPPPASAMDADAKASLAATAANAELLDDHPPRDGL